MTTATQAPPAEIEYKGHTGTLFTAGGRPCYTFDSIVQLSPEWWEVRRGIPTASEFDSIITPKKAEPSKAQRGYIARLCGERMALDPKVLTDYPGNPAMKHGRDTEAEARSWYALERGCRVKQTGFAVCNLMSGKGKFRPVGSSPDGVIPDGDEEGPGGLELKCPQPETHAEYLMDALDDPDNALPAKYKPQVHGHLIVLGVKWVDFMSYCRGMDPLLVRVRRDAYTAALERYLPAFWDDYDVAISRLGGQPARAVIEGKAELDD